MGIGGAVVLLGGLAKVGYITVDIPKIEKQVLTTYYAHTTTYFLLLTTPNPCPTTRPRVSLPIYLSILSVY